MMKDIVGDSREYSNVLKSGGARKCDSTPITGISVSNTIFHDLSPYYSVRKGNEVLTIKSVYSAVHSLGIQ